MATIASGLAIRLFGIILSLLNYSFCVPSVTLGNRQISGRTIEFEGYQVNEYLGIRYAQPPIGPLRFQKTQKLLKVPRMFNAINVPPACPQYSVSPFASYINGTFKSEDCLFLNIWTPFDACPENKKAVMFWVYGGGFRYGSIQDPLYSGVALAAEGDIIVVTANYRVGAFGFLTTDTDEAPGNAGLWDILESLQWVNQHIEYFGGDASRITLAGESAGSIAVAYFSTSPLATGLFSQMIMESGSIGTIPEDTKLYNLALTELLASKVGCTKDSYKLADHRQSVTECLKRVKAEDLAKAESEILPNFSLDFLPQYGDQLLPKNPQKALLKGEFRCKKLLIGNNRDEGSLFLTTAFPEIFGFFGEKKPDIGPKAGAELFEKVATYLTPNLQPGQKSPDPVDNPLMKEVFGLFPDIQSDTLNSHFRHVYYPSLIKLYTLIGDAMFVCPDEYYAEKCSEIGGDVYYYWFVHRPSTTPWAPWMGVAHFEEVQFVFGKPLLQPGLYVDFERKLSKEIIELWSNFVKTGKPDESWPLYSKKNPAFRYIGNSDSSKKFGIGPHKAACELLRSSSVV